MHEIVKKTIEFYDSAYKSFSVTRNKHPWLVLVKWAEEVKGKDKILDLGCGNGRLYPLLKDHQQYLAVDPVKGFLKEVREKYEVETFQAALPMVPSDIGTFDKVFCIAVLQHIPKQLHLASLQNIHKLLHKDGILYLTCWNVLYHRRIFNPLKRNYWIPYKADNKPKYRYIYRFTPKYLKSLLKKSGFEVQYCHFGEIDKTMKIYNAPNLILKAKRL